MAALPPFVIPLPTGEASVTLAIPNDPTLAGLTGSAQALLVQYPTLTRLTNVTADVILR